MFKPLHSFVRIAYNASIRAYMTVDLAVGELKWYNTTIIDIHHLPILPLYDRVF